MRSTKINGRDIPILPGEAIGVSFAPGSPYPGDEGNWSYWTLFKDYRGITGRWKGDDPGERFRRMEGDPVHADAWSFACVATTLRPATRKEVESWLDTHLIEAAYAGTFQQGSMSGKVVQTPDGYRLE